MSGLFTSVGGTLENGMGTYVTNVSSALSSALVPAVTTAVTIWVLAYGLAVVRGEAHESVPAFAWRGLKLAIILAFALGTGIYQAQVVTAVNDVTAGLAQTIQSAAANTGAGNPGCGSVSGSSVTGSSAAGIYQTLDCYDQQIDLVMDAYFDQATHEGFSVSGIVAGVGDCLCGLVAALGGSIFLMVLAFEVVMARMLLDLVLGLGPAFIACGAFGPTARFFEAWTAKVANYALLQILVAAFLGMALTAFSSDLATFHVTTSAPGANAASLVANAQQRLTGVATLASALGLFVTGAFLAMVGWQLPAVASGLAGGATLSGFGAFVAGLASRQVIGASCPCSVGDMASGARAVRSTIVAAPVVVPGIAPVVPRAAAVKCRRINVRPVNTWVARVTEARANIMSKPYALVRVAAAAVFAVAFVGPVHAQGIPVFDAQNVAQAISTVAQLEQQVQQEIQLYQSMNGSRGFGALLSNPVLANSLPSNWTSVYTAIQNGGYAGLTGSAQALRSAGEIYNCEDQRGIDQQVCQRALNKPFQDKAFGMQAYQTELQELNQIQSLMQQIDVTQDPKGVAELQARIQSESTAVGSEMTKLQLFRMLSDTEDRLIAEQQGELVMSRAGNTARLQDQMVPATFGN